MRLRPHWQAVTTAQMRHLDRQAQTTFAIPSLILMEHAGLAVAQQVHKILLRNRSQKGTIWVFAGGGANGGDGFVAARHLHNWGYAVGVVVLTDIGRIQGDAQVNWRILRRSRVKIHVADTVSRWRAWASQTRSIRLIVDAMLGIGCKGAIREPIRSAILWLNRKSYPVVAVDVPSGFSADKGMPLDVAVRAICTVTCGWPKVGCMERKARFWCGRVVVADIALPRPLRYPGHRFAWMDQSP